MPSLEDGRRQHVRYLKASAAVDCLQRNVDAEHALYTDFLLTFWQASSRPPCCWGFAARACRAPNLCFSQGVAATAAAVMPLMWKSSAYCRSVR